MTGSITWEALAYLIPVFGAGAGLWWKLHSQISNVERMLTAYKLDVAQNYATNKSIREVEERVVQAIDRLGDRLDRFLEKTRP